MYQVVNHHNMYVFQRMYIALLSLEKSTQCTASGQYRSSLTVTWIESVVASTICAQKLNPLQIGAHIVEVAKTLILYSDATLFPFYSLGRKVKAKLYQIDCCHCSGSYYIVLLLLCNYMLSIGARDCHIRAQEILHKIRNKVKVTKLKCWKNVRILKY